MLVEVVDVVLVLEDLVGHARHGLEVVGLGRPDGEAREPVLLAGHLGGHAGSNGTVLMVPAGGGVGVPASHGGTEDEGSVGGLDVGVSGERWRDGACGDRVAGDAGSGGRVCQMQL